MVNENLFEGLDLSAIIGEGTYGSVYKYRDRESGEIFAIKVLRDQSLRHQQQLKEEFRRLLAFSHPNLVKHYRLKVSDTVSYIVMEYIEGKNLRQYVWGSDAISLPPIQTFDPSTTFDEEDDGAPRVLKSVRAVSPDISDAFFYRLHHALESLAKGLVELHTFNLVHRDLKPSNILVRRSGEVVLLDFGLVAILAEQSEERIVRYAAGTVGYASPEQMNGMRASPASDWYSVGVILYELLLGRLPFHGMSTNAIDNVFLYKPLPPHEQNPLIPEDLSKLVLHLLAYDPAQRADATHIVSYLASTRQLTAAILEAPAIPPSFVIGREDHLDLLHNALRLSRDHRAIAALVHGPSGIGKSSILQRFFDDLNSHKDLIVVMGRCRERETVPFKALDEIIDQLGEQVQRLDLVRQIPDDIEAATFKVFPALSRRIYSFDELNSRLRHLDPPEVRRRAIRGLRSWIEILGQNGPVVLLIDDLQWGDIDGAYVLTELLSDDTPLKLLFVASYRDEEATTSECMIHLLRHLEAQSPVNVKVGNLPPEKIRQMIEEVTWQTDGEKSRRLTPAEVDRIVIEAGGSPFFARELLYSRLTRISASPSGEAIEHLPSTVESLDDLIQRRVMGLGEGDRSIVELLAVAGEPLPQDIATRQLSRGSAVEAIIRTLESSRLVRPRRNPETRDLDIYHDRIRESTYASLPPMKRRDLHLFLGTHLETRPHASPETLARHFLQAGDVNKGRRYTIAGARMASEKLAFARAVELLEKGLELRSGDDLETRELLAELGKARVNAGKFQAGADAYDQAAKCAAHNDNFRETMDFIRLASHQYLCNGKPDEALRVVEPVLASVGLRRFSPQWITLVAIVWFRILIRLVPILPLRALSPAKREFLELKADFCWTIRRLYMFVDPLDAFLFISWLHFLALRINSQRHLALARGSELTFEAGFGRFEAASMKMESVRTMSRELSPVIQIASEVFSAVLELCRGDWQAAYEFSMSVERRWQVAPADVVGELNRVLYWSDIRYSQFSGLFLMGEFKVLREKLLAYFQMADDRGDTMGKWQARLCFDFRLKVLAGDAEWALNEIRNIRPAMTRIKPLLRVFFAFVAVSDCHLYLQHYDEALDAAKKFCDFMRGSRLSRVLRIRITSDCILGRAALGLLCNSQTAEMNASKALVSRAITRLNATKVNSAKIYSLLLEAGLTSLDQNAERIIPMLQNAKEIALHEHMAFHATCANWLIGALTTDNEPREKKEAELWFADQGVKYIPNVIQMMIPGAWQLSSRTARLRLFPMAHSGSMQA